MSNFFIRCEVGTQPNSFACQYPVVLEPFVEKTVLFPLKSTGTLSEHLSILKRSILIFMDPYSVVPVMNSFLVSLKTTLGLLWVYSFCIQVHDALDVFHMVFGLQHNLLKIFCPSCLCSCQNSLVHVCVNLLTSCVSLICLHATTSLNFSSSIYKSCNQC